MCEMKIRCKRLREILYMWKDFCRKCDIKNLKKILFSGKKILSWKCDIKHLAKILWLGKNF